MKPLVLLALVPVLLLTACSEQELLQQLSEQQANDVVAVLQIHNVSAVKEYQGKTGFAVNVAPSDFPAAVDLLRKYDLPKAARVQIGQLFPAEALVSSPQAERARMLSGVEQRIEQSLATLDNVATARVQLSYPVGTTPEDKRTAPMRASVLLSYRNEVNADLLVSQVKRFVRNSFSDMEYENISVILNPAAALYHGPTTRPARTLRDTWRYWLLLPLPIATCATIAGWLIYVRRRRTLARPHILTDERPSSDNGNRERDTANEARNVQSDSQNVGHRPATTSPNGAVGGGKK
jgi:type III secretion protein J